MNPQMTQIDADDKDKMNPQMTQIDTDAKDKTNPQMTQIDADDKGKMNPQMTQIDADAKDPQTHAIIGAAIDVHRQLIARSRIPRGISADDAD